MIKIFKNDHTLLRELQVDDRSYRLKVVMGENSLYLYFELPNYLEIPINSYALFQGEKYTLFSSENFTKEHSRHWKYSLKLEADSTITAGVRFKFFAGSFKKFKLDFPLTMKPIGFIQLLVDNLNLADSVWSIGNVIDADEKTLLFNDESCQEALAKIAEAFNTEFEIIGKTIHLRKVEKTDPALPLAYGKDKGLKPGVRSNGADKNRPINRLYVIGTDRNIDSEKYGNPTLLLPKSTEVNCSGVTYITDSEGIYIERKGLTGSRVEASLDLTHIYPSRIGKVSEVVTVDTEKHFYDIEDNSIPADLNYKDYIISGNEMQLVFQSGALAGIEFKVDYDHENKRFKLHPKEEHGLTYPTAPDLPKIGDEYAIFQVQLPDNYIADASNKMLEDAAKALWEGEQVQKMVAGVLDDVFASKRWADIEPKIQLGQVVSLSDEDFMPSPTLLRIISVKQYVNNSQAPYVELANRIELRSFAQALASMKADARSRAYSEVLKNNDRLKDLFLFKNATDTANSHITFKDGFTADRGIIDNITILSRIQSEAFNSGFLGEGFSLKKNDLGNWDMELDNLVVRKNMNVFRLTIQEIKSVGGQLLLSPANMRCTKVEELTSVYRCYFNTDGGTVPNYFEVGDQAICQRFDGKGQKRYWRLVTAVGSDYIELSKKDCDGSGVPAKDDEIVQLGHRTNPTRQNAILISSYGTPKIEQFKGINTYSTESKLVTRISPDGNLFRSVDFTVETADAAQYLRLKDGKLEINATTTFTADSPALQQAKEIAQEKVDALKFSSQNILNNSSFENSYGYLRANGSYSDGIRTLRKSSTSDTTGAIYKTFEIDERFIGKELTFSVEINVLTYAYIKMAVRDNGVFTWGDKFGITEVGKGVLKSLTFTITSTTIMLYLYTYSVNPLEIIEGFMLTEGNKPCRWAFSEADRQAELSKQITASEAKMREAWENYTNLQANLAETNAKASADGKITAEEQARIDSVANALATAKTYAETQDALLKAQQKAYADGEISLAEQRAINVAEAKANLAETNAKAHADNVVTAEEQARIADAETKLLEAKAHAKELDDSIKIGGVNLLNGTRDFRQDNPLFSGSKFKNFQIVEKGGHKAFSNGMQRGAFWLKINIPELVEGEEYTFSFYYFREYSEREFLLQVNSNYHYFTTNILNSWRRESLTFIAEGNNVVYIGGKVSDAFYTLNCRDFRLEEGNRVTSSSVSENDRKAETTAKVAEAKSILQAQIDASRTALVNQISALENKNDFLKATTINGATVFTGVAAVGNENGSNAGITGIDAGDEAVRLFAGSDFAGRNSAPFRVLDNGEMHSTSGFIGGFSISDQELSSGLSLYQKQTHLELNSKGYIYSHKHYGPSSPTPSLNWLKGNQVKINAPCEDYIWNTGDNAGEVLYVQALMKGFTALKIRANYHSCALNIEEGTLRIKGKNGYTGVVNGLVIQDGIIVGVE